MADTTSTSARARKRRTIRSAKSISAEARFMEIIAGKGARSLESEWTGTAVPHKIMCRNGHISRPHPGRVLQGVGICGGCIGRNGEAEKLFRERLNEERVVMLDPYQTATTRVRFRCWEGHEFISTPSHLVRKKSLMCRFCQGSDQDSMLARLRVAVEEHLGELLESEWLGSHRGHLVRCAKGHLRQVFPSKLFSGRSLCADCKGYTPEALARQYVEIVRELGGTPLDDYCGATKPHRVRCPEGHVGTPTPHNLLQGGGLCRFCAGKAWDVFYVVQDGINDVIKFGITSGDPRPRLGIHERDGFEQVVRLAEGLPDDTAPELERMILAALRDAREKPVRGREYYHVRALPLVLDLVDNHPAIRCPEAVRPVQ